MLKDSPLATGILMMFVSCAAGIALGYVIGIDTRGVCKSYNVEATNQTVEICTRIMK